MSLDPGDKRVEDPRREELPRVVACIVHPTMTAVRHCEAKEIDGYEIVRYGLCMWCDKKLKHDKTYAVHIDRKICERLEQLKPEGGK